MARVMKQDDKLREKFQELIDKKKAEQSANKGNEIPGIFGGRRFRKRSFIISPELKGKIGEYNIADKLEEILSDNWIILNDVLIELRESLVQIDHVIIGLPGIFIIETKSWHGSYSGYRDKWKRREHSNWLECHSPTLQSIRQATLLKQWLINSKLTNLPSNVNKYITPLVVFTVAKWVKFTKCSTLVFENKESLISYFYTHKNNYLTLEQVNQIAYLIANYPSYEDFQNQSQIVLPPLSLDKADRHEQEAISKAKQGRYQEAIEDFTLALNINPCSPRTYRYRGVARSRLGDMRNAVIDLKKAADLYQEEGKLTAHQQLLKEITNLETSTNELESTDPIIGVYQWFTGTRVELTAERVIYSQTPKWEKCGTWEHNSSRTYILTWFGGTFIDTLTLSSDCSTLNGTNHYGGGISAVRIN